MSNASFALPRSGTPFAFRDGGSSTPTVPAGRPSLAARAVRFGRFLAQLVRLYVDACVTAPRLPRSARAELMQRWAHRMLRPLRIDVRVRGHIPAPDSPLLLVANHLSWIDVYALNTVTNARFVAKSEVRD